MFIRLIVPFLILGLLGSCGSSQNNAIKTFQSQESEFHMTIENETANKYPAGTYKSLAFAETKVYKPIEFYKLDSIYAIKERYVENKDWRGLQDSGVEESIPSYRAAAQAVMHEVKYEIEHIYQARVKDSLQIHHAFYIFDHKNELKSITPFYHFDIDAAEQNLFYKYQFNIHFLTDRDLHISNEEWNFLQFLKAREIQLIKEEELQGYMDHVMLLMKIASVSHSVDFNDIAKYLVLLKLKELGGKIIINDIDQLYVNSIDEEIISYQIVVEWQFEDSKQLNKSTFEFSPYLEILGVESINQ